MSLKRKILATKHVGYMNMYIRGQDREGYRKSSVPIRFPTARYDRSTFRMHMRISAFSL